MKGWLDKYNDGGPVQPNYNDYSVSAGPGFEGDGYSNVGRNYSPAWGGQFQKGGKVKPITVTDKNDPRLKAYQDSLSLYNLSNRLMRKATPYAPNYSFPANPILYEDYHVPYNSTGRYPDGNRSKLGLTKQENARGIDFRKEVEKSLKTKNKPLGWAYGDVAVPVYKKPTQPIMYRPEPTPQSIIDFMEGNYAQEPITEIPQVSAYGEVVDPRTGYTHMTRQGSSMYPMVGQNVPEMEEGGPVKRFMQPTETFKNYGYNPIEKGMSTEYSTSIGAPGEVYLVPGYRQGKVLQDPEGVFNTYGEHLGGPFKTVQAAEDFGKLRHKYVEQNKDIPAPFKTRDYAMGGSIGGATQGIPGATGFMYSRDSGSNPSEDEGRNKVYKTDASAQDGTMLSNQDASTYIKIPNKQEVDILKSAKSDIINEGNSINRLRMLKNAVRHDMSIEQFKPLEEIDEVDLNKRTLELANKKQQNLNNPRVEFISGNGISKNDILGYFNPTNSDGVITLSNNINNINELKETSRHEYRHAYDDAGKLLTNYEKQFIGSKTAEGDVDKIKAIGRDQYKYLTNPTEITARLQEIRGGLKDAKVYDASKDKATLEHLNSAKNISGYQDLLQVMKPEDIVDLLNTIAAKNSKKGKPTAQNGAEMKFYQEGLDFKPKSMQKGGKTTTRFLPPQFKRDEEEEEEVKPNPILENTIEEIEPEINDGGFWKSPIEQLETIDPYETKIDRLKREAPKELIKQSSSPYRYNMLRDAVRHDIASERGVALTDINEDELTDRTEQLLSKKEKQLDKIPIISLDYNLGERKNAGWSPATNSIYISKDSLGWLDDDINNIGTNMFNSLLHHELRHSYDKGGEYLTNYEKKLIDDKRKKDISNENYLYQKEYNYLNDPWEITARLEEIRTYIKPGGEYDPSKDKATVENLRKAASGSRAYNDLLLLMSPQDIVDLLNTIATNNPKQGMPAAKNGKKVIKDDRGQWDHPGEITEIGSNQITMQGVPYPVIGISNTGDMQMMYPNQEYQYDGNSVTEYPMMAQGGQLTKLDQLTNFTNYNTKQPGGWLDKYQ